MSVIPAGYPTAGVPFDRMRGFDRNLLRSGGPLEKRVDEPVPFCWFCDAPAGQRAKEHVFPTWLQKHYGAEREVVSPHRISMPLGGQVASQRNSMPLSAVVAGKVCARGNNEWMSTLETDVRPVLTAAPRRGPISGYDAHLLARWFTKTAVALNVSMPFRLLFDRDTRHALSTGMPPNVRIFLSISNRHAGAPTGRRRPPSNS